jgi:hypothetical protein
MAAEGFGMKSLKYIYNSKEHLKEILFKLFFLISFLPKVTYMISKRRTSHLTDNYNI